MKGDFFMMELKTILNFKELYEKFNNMEREDMTTEQERDFVEKCFEIYENVGFAETN